LQSDFRLLVNNFPLDYAKNNLRLTDDKKALTNVKQIN